MRLPSILPSHPVVAASVVADSAAAAAVAVAAAASDADAPTFRPIHSLSENFAIFFRVVDAAEEITSANHA